MSLFFDDVEKMRNAIFRLFELCDGASNMKMLLSTFKSEWQNNERTKRAVLNALDDVYISAASTLSPVEAVDTVEYVEEECLKYVSTDEMYEHIELGYILHRLNREAGTYSECQNHYEWDRERNSSVVQVCNSLLSTFQYVSVENKEKVDKAILGELRESLWLQNVEFFETLIVFLPEEERVVAKQYQIHCQTMQTCKERQSFLDTYWPSK